jgi:hypothetical protein
MTVACARRCGRLGNQLDPWFGMTRPEVDRRSLLPGAALRHNAPQQTPAPTPGERRGVALTPRLRETTP